MLRTTVIAILFLIGLAQLKAFVPSPKHAFQSSSLNLAITDEPVVGGQQHLPVQMAMRQASVVATLALAIFASPSLALADGTSIANPSLSEFLRP